VYVHIHVSQEGHSRCELAVVVNTISQLDIQILYTVVYKHLKSRTFVFKCRVYVDARRRTVQQLAEQLSTAHGYTQLCCRCTEQRVVPV